MLLGYPKAQILSFDDGKIHEIEYERTPSTQIIRRFVNDRETFLKELLRGHLRCSKRNLNSSVGQKMPSAQGFLCRLRRNRRGS